MKLVSFNILHDAVERKARMSRAAETVKELDGDIIALQEVATGLFLSGDPVEVMLNILQPKLLWANRFWQETNLGMYRNGLALLSPYPMTYGHYQAFDASVIFDRKGFMETEVLMPEGRVRFLNVHMRSSSKASVKVREFRQLAAYLADAGSRLPVVIMGDFNWDWHDPVFQDFAKRAGAKSLYDTMPDPNARLVTWTDNYKDPCNTRMPEENGQQLDNIMLIPGASGPKWILKKGEVHVPTRLPHPSDHCPIAVELTVAK